MLNLNKKPNNFSSYHIIIFSFLVLILVGAGILSTPFVTTSGEATNFLNALFTATSSVCVTGLSVVSTYNYWNFYGKVVILILIKIGSLGFITLTTLVLYLLRKNISLKNRILIKESFNLLNFQDVIKILKKIIIVTFIIEFIGAFFLSFIFVKDFGLIKGIGMSIFHSTSAFCNAGFDIIGENSLIDYTSSYIINITLSILIVLGGLGFTVWLDLLNLTKNIFSKKISVKCSFNRLSLHSKLVLNTSLILIFLGWVSIFILEFNNQNTLGSLTFNQKVLASFFQSITLRTAGFFSISQENLTDGSKFLSIVLMAIGGSPGGTAGGIKTVTIAVLFLAVISIVKNKSSISAFKKAINFKYVQRALSIVMLILSLIFIFTINLTITEANSNYAFIDLLFEVTSALATVGLSTGLTPNLSSLGKIIIITCMFIGRIGPMTIALALSSKKDVNKNSINYPENKILVG